MDEPTPFHLTVRAVLAIVAEEFGIAPSVIAACGRKHLVIQPRHITMWLAHRHTGHSLVMIGKALGDRDHTSVLHGSRSIEARRAEDTALAERLERLVNKINATEAGLLSAAEPKPAPHPPATQAEPCPAPEPAIVLIGSSRAERSVLEALDRYLAARDVLVAHTHTRAELGARRHADEAYRDLRRIHSELKLTRQNGSAAA